MKTQNKIIGWAATLGIGDGLTTLGTNSVIINFESIIYSLGITLSTFAMVLVPVYLFVKFYDSFPDYYKRHELRTMNSRLSALEDKILKPEEVKNMFEETEKEDMEED